jgi:Domain of unknown function (DUF4167)
MRPGQHNNNNNNKNRNRNRNRRHTGSGGGGGQGGGGTGANRVYDSNGPDVKLRGTAQTVAEKYMQLARDAHSSGDSVMAESYYQFADHYYRVWLAAQPVGQPLQFSRRLAEDEYDEDGNEQNAEGESEAGDNENAEGGEGPDSGPVAEAGDAAPDGEGQPQGYQNRQNNNRNFRDNNNNNNRDNNSRDGGFNRNRQRWPRRNDRFNQEGQNAGPGGDVVAEGGERVERPADEVVVQPRLAEVADTGNWEAPSFLTRPVPAVSESADVAIEADAPPPRHRGRKPRVVAPIAEIPQDD